MYLSRTTSSMNLEQVLYDSGFGTWCQGTLICHILLYGAITVTINKKLKLINYFLAVHINRTYSQLLL